MKRCRMDMKVRAVREMEKYGTDMKGAAGRKF